MNKEDTVELGVKDVIEAVKKSGVVDTKERPVDLKCFAYLTRLINKKFREKKNKTVNRR